mmetsp:Transcript_27673/g.55400  ORF Transcript_27673/g.55400 Transcript_27673/m.55400 type:complete len:236 (-) Transcript_27673:1250-1957(-)
MHYYNSTSAFLDLTNKGKIDFKQQNTDGYHRERQHEMHKFVHTVRGQILAAADTLAAADILVAAADIPVAAAAGIRGAAAAGNRLDTTDPATDDPALAHVLAPAAAHALAPAADRVLAPAAARVLAPAAVHVLAPAAVRVLAPAAARVLGLVLALVLALAPAAAAHVFAAAAARALASVPAPASALSAGKRRGVHFRVQPQHPQWPGSFCTSPSPGRPGSCPGQPASRTDASALQ